MGRVRSIPEAIIDAYDLSWHPDSDGGGGCLHTEHFLQAFREFGFEIVPTKRELQREVTVVPVTDVERAAIENHVDGKTLTQEERLARIGLGTMLLLAPKVEFTGGDPTRMTMKINDPGPFSFWKTTKGVLIERREP